MMKDRKPDSAIRCRTRCLDATTVTKARARLEGRSAVPVPYTCKISGKSETLVLVSGRFADELARRVDGIADRLDATLTAALLETDLCECDLVTLSCRPEAEVLEAIRRLVATGLLRPRSVHAMNYYAVTDCRAITGMRERVAAELAR